MVAAPGEEPGRHHDVAVGRRPPIHGDPGLPAVTKVFADLRRHPGTMRLLLQESLARRAKLHSVRDVLTRARHLRHQGERVAADRQHRPLGGLSVGSAALPTVERLRAAAGSAMLPTEQADNLIEVFEVLQRMRLRYQLERYERAETPTDVLGLDRLSPIDRSMIAQAVPRSPRSSAEWTTSRCTSRPMPGRRTLGSEWGMVIPTLRLTGRNGRPSPQPSPSAPAE